MTTLMWFRNDLRLTDNPALHHSLQASEQLHGCFIVCQQFIDEHPINPRQLWFIGQHLRLLQQAFSRAGRAFTLLQVSRAADIPAALVALCREQNISRLAFNAEYPLNETRRDTAAVTALEAAGVVCKRYHDRALVPPGMPSSQQGNVYKAYTPFARAWRTLVQSLQFSAYTAVVKPMSAVDQTRSHTTAEAELIDTVFNRLVSADVSASMAELWPVGEAAAAATLTQFCHTKINTYHQARDYPAMAGTSTVSAYLAIGVLSPKQCLLAARGDAGDCCHDSEGVACWVSELIWRDFYMHIGAAFPALSRHRPMQAYTEAFPWEDDPTVFKRWCEGQTGIPIVDAAMRQLNQTGWMHNRLRMVSAMFLTKNLRIDWRMGERYFMEQLIDADFSANNGGWQWSASTGTDAAPYFRIMNPQSQSERFDADGEFIKRFVPELKHLTGKKIHNPAGSVKDYPAPMVDLKESRATTIALFKALK